MKNILLILTIATSIIGCSKEDNTSNEPPHEIITDELDVEELVNLIDHSVSDVKALYKGYLINETNTDGKTELSYHFPTKEKEYTSLFRFNTAGNLQEVEVKILGEIGYPDGIDFTKKLSVRFDDIYKDKRYSGCIVIINNGVPSFGEREELWEYLSDQTNFSEIWENWLLRDIGEEIGGENDIIVRLDYQVLKKAIIVTVIKNI